VFKDGKAKDINFLGMSGDSYNSGNWKDKNVPQEYLKRLIKHYHMARNSGLFINLCDINIPKPW
jgi:hypothetical protein